MKTVWFYALRELKRRYLQFAGIFFAVGTSVFVPVTLYGFTEARHGRGWNEQFFFIFAVIAVIVFGNAYMTLADKYDKFSPDYSALLRLGMPRRYIGNIQAVEISVIFILAAALFYPLSIVVLRVVFERYHAGFFDYPWIDDERFAVFSLPERMKMPRFGPGVLMLLGIIYAVLMLAVYVAYRRCRRMPPVCVNLREADGGLHGEEKLESAIETAVYSSVTAGRMKRIFRHTGLTVVFSLLVPVVMMCGGLSSSAVQYDSDVVISPYNDGIPVTQTLIDSLREIEGVESIDVRSHELHDGRVVFGSVKICLSEEEFHETALEIAGNPLIREYDVKYICISEISTNMMYRMNREYFFLTAAVSFLSGLVSIGFSMNECLIARREEMRILERFGMEKKRRIEVKFCGNLAMYLPSVIKTAVFGLTVYLGMSIYGGDSLKLSQIILAVSVCTILTLFTAILAALLSAASEETHR